MALAANALTTLETLKTELGLLDKSTYDAVLERQINAASDAIERYVGRTLYRGTVTSERVKGYGDRILLLARTPIVSVTSITRGGSTVDASSYYVENAEVGSVYSSTGWVWTAAPLEGVAVQDQVPGTEEASYLVTYVGGYQTPAQGGTRTLPYDLEEAALITAVNAFRNRGKYQSLQTETEAQEDATWRGDFIPGPALRLLKRYRRAGV